MAMGVFAQPCKIKTNNINCNSATFYLAFYNLPPPPPPKKKKKKKNLRRTKINIFSKHIFGFVYLIGAKWHVNLFLL
jgi:hypothetical protein